uniref:Uncharacterized protein n=1 Tax=Octopus bimaculoides TaxID=37653 RepID=A0A0L8I899_OCTBM
MMFDEEYRCKLYKFCKTLKLITFLLETIAAYFKPCCNVTLSVTLLSFQDFP